ncbi:ribonuclease H [Agrobacterium rubi TR3 = NBRC 13261]|uniref:ribonuclease H n=1 Tax=Agrobacterium rubi TR3 = NBRC 13261 TaxID=1368415 RepID=A0A081CTU3_9HYPH|nr:ribonuclease H [Agrobacterium rubi]MBP1878394.1 ribonuclease HI [Agrobacterium rubi]GAK70089.1 ribonuclease H [Agrobacterium rubi TR3 = NBRC 13261]
MTGHDISQRPDAARLATTDRLDIYVDGSYDVASKRGGWAFVVLDGDHTVASQSGSFDADTNNALEVVATLNAAQWVHENARSCPVTIWSDSMHVVEGCNHWRPIWRNNGWRRYSPNPRTRNRRIADWQLWAALHRYLCENPLLDVAWCKGHQGNIGNELADRLAGAAYCSALLP